METPTIHTRLDEILNPKAIPKEWAVNDETQVEDFSTRLPPDKMALEFSHKLDLFQKRAILRIENNEDVFVSAHTSSGKSVVAEYAIAKSLLNGRKAIYTSPIKALSNQKYRDFRMKFNHIEANEAFNDDFNYYGEDHWGDNDYDGFSNPVYDFNTNSDDEGNVGIITGDVQLNQTAPCLVMTTEILRTMIYENDPVLQDIEWVIFDEIHYMNNPERGRIWEETIALLPNHIRMVFLSATAPNSLEFSEWVGREKCRPVYVVSTVKRPIPLHHYVHTGTHDTDLVGYYKTDDELKSDDMDRLDTTKMTQEELADAMATIQKKKYTKTRLKDDVDVDFKEKEGVYLLVDGDNKFNEVACKEIKRIADLKRGDNYRKSALNFNQTKSHWINLFKLMRIKQKFPVITFVFSKKMCSTLADHLQHEDYTTKREKSKITVFFKKCMDKLREEDRDIPQIIYVKQLLMRGIAVHHGGLLPILKEVTEILFAKGFIRIMFASETMAMGVNLPTRTVIFSGVKKHDGTQFRHLLPGEYTQMSGRAGRRGLDDTGTVMLLHWKPDHINYKTLISGKPLTLTSQFRLTYQTILSIFSKHSMEKDVTGLMRSSFSEFNSKRDASQVYKTNACIYDGKLAIKKIEEEGIQQFESSVPDTEQVNYQQCVEFYSKWKNICNTFQTKCLETCYFAGRLHKDAWLLVSPEKGVWPSPMQIVTVYESHLMGKYPDNDNIVRIEYDWIFMICRDLQYKTVDDSDYCHYQIKSVEPVVFRKKDKVNIDILVYMTEMYATINDMYEYNQIHYHKNVEDLIKQQYNIESKIDKCTSMVEDKNLYLYNDFTSRVDVLKEMGFLEKDEVLTVKGKVASRINTCHEIILTEFILDNGLDGLDIPQTAALLSCFVTGGGCKDELPNYEYLKKIDTVLYKKVDHVYKICVRLIDLESKHGIERVQMFNHSMSVLVYHWANGDLFSDIMKYSDTMEGTIVRSMMRLDELCKEIGRVATVIGDPSLEKKMEDTSNAIRRDIVFVGSLYVE
jgi:antiviral helicase SKI2